MPHQTLTLKKETLERTSDDESKPDRFTGPVGYAIDSDDTTAWGIDIGPGRSNVPREAVFALDKPSKVKSPSITFSLSNPTEVGELIPP